MNKNSLLYGYRTMKPHQFYFELLPESTDFNVKDTPMRAILHYFTNYIYAV